MNPFFLAGQLYLLASAPVGQSNQLWGYTWQPPGITIPYEEKESSIPCSDEKAATASTCVQTISVRELNSNMPAAAPVVPKGSTAVLLALKTKVWIKKSNQKGLQYCQMDVRIARDTAELEHQNHVAHIEASVPSGRERRRVNVNQIVVPINKEGQFTTSIHRGIYGHCETEVLFTLVGFYK